MSKKRRGASPRPPRIDALEGTATAIANYSHPNIEFEYFFKILTYFLLMPKRNLYINS
jgi:hypothetical protein